MSEPKATYGIIGNPLKHSLSPIMQNAAFKELGVEAIYKTFEMEEDALGDFFSDLKKEESPIFGLNVTVPYKEKVIKFCDSVSPFAEKVGAVNTITIDKNRKIIGYNTDGPGFLSHLVELQFNTRNKRIAILGSGGSARAILASLCLIPERAHSIKIYNRTQSRAQDLINEFQPRMNLDIVESVLSVDDLNIELADLLINTTSVGMKKDDPCLVEEHLFHPDMLVYDLIYSPKETLLLKMAKEGGAQIANGLGMLYYQGVLALEHWAGDSIDDKVKKRMREALEMSSK